MSQPKAILKMTAVLVQLPNSPLMDVLLDYEGAMHPIFVDAILGGTKRLMEMELTKAMKQMNEPKIQISPDMPGIRNKLADAVQ
jgi:hypothetical protein